MMKKLIKEPLVHFLVIGAMIFAFNAWRSQGRPSVTAKPRIEVTAGTIVWLDEGFAKTWHRAPDERELRGLVQDHVREELLYREALALGLEQDDTIVRRRMAQKMEFLAQDLANSAPPQEEALRAYFLKHSAQYARSSKISFEQVYFSRERRGAQLEADARQALDALVNGADAGTLGDPFLGQLTFTEVDSQAITAALGGEFSTAVLSLAGENWQGPITSTYGAHLVRVTGRVAAESVAYKDVRETVAKDYAEDRRVAANSEFIEKLRTRYDVVIDESAIRNSTANQTAQR